MKRRLLIILLLLVAGAIVNVAVAWGFAFRVNISSTTRAIPQTGITFPDSTNSKHWVATRTEQAGVMRIACIWPSSRINAWTTNSAEAIVGDWLRVVDSDRQGCEQLMIDARGWPAKSLFSVVRLNIIRQMRAPSERPVYEFSGAIEAPDWSASNVQMYRNLRMLPLRPIWPGFAINTAFYAAVLWLLFAAPFALRRRRRIKRGLCPKCAYPVGTNERCTECGATHDVKP